MNDPITVRPGDPRYDALTSGINQRYRSAPHEVLLPRTTEEVVTAVRRAWAAGRPAVRSGGHCFEDFVDRDDADVLIDLSQMDAVSFDERHGAFSVEAGARLLNVYEQLHHGWGVTVPGGICYSVGVGGHVTGGGYGLLSRRDGLTVDHLHGVEVVVVDAGGRVRPVLVTRDSTGDEADLFWAHTGGGGGTFGVVTRFLFRTPGPGPALPRPPSQVLVSALSVPWSRLDERGFARLLGGFSRWHERHRAPDTPATALSSILMLNHRSNGSVGLLAQVDADAPDPAGMLDDYLTTVLGDVRAEPMTGPAGEFGPLPWFAEPRRLPWMQATRLLGTNTPILNDPTMRGEHKSAYVRRELPAGQLATAYHQLTRDDVTNPNAMLVALSYGGRIGDVGPSETAVAQRDSAFKLLYQSFWSDPAGDAANVAWVREFYRAMYADTGGVPVPDEDTDGCYVNYPDADLSDPDQNTSGVPWHDLYFKDNHPRLQRAKQRWDPLGVFGHRQSVSAPEHAHAGGRRDG